MPANLSLSLTMLLRDWRAGELRVLTLALVIAVASVTSVAFFADRVWQALTHEANQMLGADVLLQSDHPFAPELRAESARRGLHYADGVSFVSMARAGEATQLAGVKAVSAGYPLRGKLRIAPRLNAADAETDTIPPPGSVWLDERLSAALGVTPGEQIELGNARMTVGAVLTLEPDRGVSFFNIAPRLLMRADDLPATGLIQTGSRASYQFYVAGERRATDAYAAWAKPKLGPGQRIESLGNARPEVRAGLDRAQQFLGLSAMLAVILAAVAIALSTRRYTQRHLDGYAVLRCFGALQGRLFALFSWEFVLLGLAASALGCALGFAGQAVIALWLTDFVASSLPPPGIYPLLQGFAAGLLLLLGFALPPLMQLKNVPAIRVIRREVGAPKQSALAGYALGLAALAALLLWQAGEVRLGATVFGGFTAAFIAFWLMSLGALRLFAALGRAGSVSWRYGLANLRRRSRANAVQIVALALGLTVLLLLTFIRGDLLEAWRTKLPQDAPNRFVVNIQPEQVRPLERFLAQNGIAAPSTFPMVRARLTAINGRPVGAADYTDERAKRQIDREFNLSFMRSPPPGNQVTGGHWFTREDFAQGSVSIEVWIAERLGINLGDSLSFSGGGATVTVPVSSVRKLDWDTMRPNFFFVTTPGALARFPASYMSTFRLPGSDALFTARLTQAFPNLTVIDVSAVMRQVNTVLDQVIRAVEFVFLFALVAGVLVLYAALLSTQDERVQEAALMRALGARRAQVAGAQRAEFFALGLVAGILASAGATAIGYVLAERVFQFPWQFNIAIWIVGPVAGLACVALNAWLGARAALNHPPMLALREA
ncbi:MAG: FtsX-like permease family protein [Betaproteobacteria bacterium]|nr:MAG: FtsX-like permease family protein [Betaproteobacteria bacterium]